MEPTTAAALADALALAEGAASPLLEQWRQRLENASAADVSGLHALMLFGWYKDPGAASDDDVVKQGLNWRVPTLFVQSTDPWQAYASSFEPLCLQKISQCACFLSN